MPNPRHKISIIADDRERQSKVPEILSAYENVDLTIKRLKLGDYLLDNHILVERKTLRDFASSIIDGRIFKQAAMLAYSEFHPVVILEGTAQDLKKCHIPRQGLQGALIYVSMTLGLPVLRSLSPHETAQLMIYITNQTQTVTSGLVKRRGYYPKRKLKRQMLILQGLPGIGKKRAKQLIERFETIKAVINASKEELTSIEGIGKTTADEILNIINDPKLEYNPNVNEFFI